MKRDPAELPGNAFFFGKVLLPLRIQKSYEDHENVERLLQDSKMVDRKGIEPSTSALRTQRSPS